MARYTAHWGTNMTTEITPSDPNFDRSGLLDQEYIERLLFEIKELKSTIVRKDQLIQSLQGTFDIPQRSRRRVKEEKLDVSQSVDDTTDMSMVGTNDTGNTVDESESNSGNTIKSPENTHLNFDDKSSVTSTSNEIHHTRAETSQSDPQDTSNIAPNSSIVQNLYNNMSEEGPYTNATPQRGPEAPAATSPATHKTSDLNPDTHTKLSPQSSVPTRTTEAIDTVYADTLNRSSVYSDERKDSITVANDTASDPVMDETMNDTMNDTNDTIGSATTFESKDTLLPTKSDMFQHVNHSSSSFLSYRSRIKLPLTLQPAVSANPEATTATASPVALHHSPSIGEPPRIPLPDSPNTSNVLSPSRGISHSKTFKDLSLRAESTGLDNTLRSPAALNFDRNDLTPRSVSDFNQPPSTPDGVYNEAMSNVSSPSIPPSSYSRASPATGFSSRFEDQGGSQGSLYNVRSTTSNRNLSSSQFNRSNLLVNRVDEDESLFVKPDDFQTISITVISTICPGNSQGQAASKKPEDVFITIAINDRGSGKEMWRIKKSLSQIIAFDNEIRPTVEYFGLPVLPDKSIFFSTTPNKIDIRLNGLQNYFNTLFVMPHIPHLILFRICKYLSLDFINPLDDFKSGARKEGYLVRKYKGLGTSWKIRWCQVDGPLLELYETPGGTMIETINLANCQIGRQSNDTVAEEKGYRHAFLIMEGQKSSKLSNSLPKHFFCAESDSERDEWVDSIIEVSTLDSNSTSTSNSIKEEAQTPRNNIDYDDLESEHSSKIKSPVQTKKRSIFPFRNKNPSTSNVEPEEPVSPLPSVHNTSMASNSSIGDDSIQLYLDKMGLDEQVHKQIFGRDLAEAAEISHHMFLGREIPSICYRCVEFLLKTGAIYEEGIFRLSGSASTIRQLKEAFNKKFDIDLFTSELKPDIHTVSGLFKTYLRELPTPIISETGYNDIRKLVMEHGTCATTSYMIRDYMHLRIDKIYLDTSYIIFKFLKQIINNKESNKMNLRNVCIVFVPTLNISLDVLCIFLIDFDCIFEGGEPVEDREVVELNIPNF